ncbi:MAG: hypothetical protein NC231_04605 [Bacillus sp. (in: Bacteria)]|nr:hypothetical protein [Bacillus sp. (in: firmicutes)]MCM1427171.1 hypothetical protein [Eubacterium sp.]
MRDINDNIYSNRYKARLENLPDDIKKKLDDFSNADIADKQLKVIKRKRSYPEIGDMFMVKPKDDLCLYGVVINNHINNIHGDDLILILIFKQGKNIERCIEEGIKGDDLLLEPTIVGKEYWTRGYFYNYAHYDQHINFYNYGFYYIGKDIFCNEYGEEIGKEPQILGLYGVATDIGIALDLNRELIIAGII